MVKTQLFKQIENPNNFRKEILESSKEVIENLKIQQRIIDIREKRFELSKELKIIFKEINLLFDQTKDHLPVEIITSFIEEQKKKTKNKPKVKTSSTKTKKKLADIMPEPSELNKLETKLADIESKLKSLN